jgi:hypothetical protein
MQGVTCVKIRIPATAKIFAAPIAPAAPQNRLQRHQ